MRPAVRLAALMKAPAIYVTDSADSVALGEDGPRHTAGRAARGSSCHPGSRHRCARETRTAAWAWKTILERRKGPAGIALTRQNIPVLIAVKKMRHRQIFAAAKRMWQARLRAGGSTRRRSGRDLHRHRLRGADRGRRPEQLKAEGINARSSRLRVRLGSRSSPPSTANRCYRRT
jgi:transketolase